MGSKGILVIGDDYEDQLDKFQSPEYAAPDNRHWVIQDGLITTKKAYEERPHNDAYYGESFVNWLWKSFRIGVLEENQKPDLDGLHHGGWIKLNESGEVVELIHRFMPHLLFDYVIGSGNVFPLKKDRSEAIAAARENARREREFRIRMNLALPAEREAQEIDLDDFTLTNSAALGDIDFDAMRLAILDQAEERWDYVATACGLKTWTPFDVLLKKHSSGKCISNAAIIGVAAYNSEYEKYKAAAYEEWCEQVAVKAILHAIKTDPFKPKSFNKSILHERVFRFTRFDSMPEIIDQFRLDKKAYASGFSLNSVFGFADVIMNGELLENFNLEQLFKNIPEDSILTNASVHC